MKPWTSPNYEGRAPWTAEACLEGQRMAEAAARWIEKHQREFNEIYRIVKRMQAKGVVGRVRDEVASEARKRGIEVREGDYKFANGLWAGLARYMAYADPSLIGNPIVFQRSAIDNYGLVPVTFTLEYFTFKRTVSKDGER